MTVEKKYISIGTLLSVISLADTDICAEFPDFQCECGFSREALDTIISRVPVEEVREAVHGVWLDAGKNMYGQNLTRCSVCNANSIEGGRFCRCCGAIMKQ